MKRISVLTSALLLAVSAANAQVGVGILAGANINNQIDHYSGNTIANQLKTGFHAGGVVDFGITKCFSVQSGMMYIMKGGQQERSFSTFAPTGRTDHKIKDKLTLSYIEMPVNFVYKIGAGPGKVLLGVGGYASALVNANTKYDYKMTKNDNDVTSETASGAQEISVGDKGNEQLHRFDFGATGLVGYQTNMGLFFRAGADLGLYNIVRTNTMNGFATTQPVPASENPSSKNMSYLLSVGYMFGGK